MAAYVYILECKDGLYYTGCTAKEISKRVLEHNQGQGANFTKTRLPVKLVYSRAYVTVDEAFQREKQIQGWSRKKKQLLIDGKEDLLEEH